MNKISLLLCMLLCAGVVFSQTVEKPAFSATYFESDCGYLVSKLKATNATGAYHWFDDNGTKIHEGVSYNFVNNSNSNVSLKAWKYGGLTTAEYLKGYKEHPANQLLKLPKEVYSGKAFTVEMWLQVPATHQRAHSVSSKIAFFNKAGRLWSCCRCFRCQFKP